jgi:anti-sigma regulatory factor (Ser/Thr protein kinase)
MESHPSASRLFDADLPLGGPASVVLTVDDMSRVGEARRTAESLGAEAGLGDAALGTLAVVATEAATNLARHGRNGRMALTPVGQPGARGIELLALDDGPGIANVGQAMEDGFSTGGTAGEGLGAIRRMAGDFDIYSRAGAGAGVGPALPARVWSAAAARAPAARRPAAGVVCVAHAGERACGDAWVVLRQRARTLVVVVDGLGHGPEAALASSEAIRIVHARYDASPGELIEAAHGALRATRGAAMAVAAIEPSLGTVAFAGVGNISASIHTAEGARSLASHNGTVGHAMRRVQEFSYPWEPEAALVAHSDGINTRWRLDGYPGLLHRDPSLLAGVLFRDFARGRDDATVVVVREPGR